MRELYLKLIEPNFSKVLPRLHLHYQVDTLVQVYRTGLPLVIQKMFLSQYRVFLNKTPFLRIANENHSNQTF